MSRFFASGGHSAGAAVSVLPMSIQGSFPLGLTGLISLLSKGLSREFISITVQKHQLFGAQLLYGPTLTSIYGAILFAVSSHGLNLVPVCVCVCVCVCLCV